MYVLVLEDGSELVFATDPAVRSLKLNLAHALVSGSLDVNLVPIEINERDEVYTYAVGDEQLAANNVYVKLGPCFDRRPDRAVLSIHPRRKEHGVKLSVMLSDDECRTLLRAKDFDLNAILPPDDLMLSAVNLLLGRRRPCPPEPGYTRVVGLCTFTDQGPDHPRLLGVTDIYTENGWQVELGEGPAEYCEIGSDELMLVGRMLSFAEYEIDSTVRD
jgi:hypothetical protein